MRARTCRPLWEAQLVRDAIITHTDARLAVCGLSERAKEIDGVRGSSQRDVALRSWARGERPPPFFSSPACQGRDRDQVERDSREGLAGALSSLELGGFVYKNLLCPSWDLFSFSPHPL